MTLLVDLTKKVQSAMISKQIFGEKANVVFVIDRSVSMTNLYKNGKVQELTDRALALGLNMDSNNSIEVIAFGKEAKELPEANDMNHVGYINKNIPSSSFEFGTRYAEPMKIVVNKFGQSKGGFFKKKTVATHPTFVIFVTDGNNSDKDAAEKLIRDSADQAIFWQFIGLGDEKFSFLEKLDDLQGRFLDNADFFQVEDLASITDDELYDKLLTEFPYWIKQARDKGILE